MHRVPRTPAAVLTALLSVFTASVTGCSKTVSIDVAVVEPCDQTDQALNGVSSFTVSSSGTDADEVVAFNVDTGPAPLNVGLGSDVIVTVKAFAEDVSSAGAASATPQAIGHTMPLALTEESTDVKALVPVGLLDSFGRTTNEAGECTSMTAEATTKGRHGHTATFVPILNQVLIYGGATFAQDGSEVPLNTAELWDPATGEFTAVDGATARAFHGATALPDGRVIVSGGFGTISGALQTLQTADIFDPASRTFSTIQLRQPRAHHTSTLMEGAGLVVLTGGCSGTGIQDACTPDTAGDGNRGDSTNLAVTVETIDINENVLLPVAITNTLGLAQPRAFHQATSLENGTNTLLVVTGGANKDGTIGGVEVFRADGGSLARVATADLANFPNGKAPARHVAVAIDPQRLLVIGGQTAAVGGKPQGPPSADVFFFSTTGGIDPTTISLFNGSGRAGHQAARLSDGSIVIVGGVTGANGPSAEVLAPAPGTGTLTARVLARPLGQSRDRGAMAVLPTNQVLFTGGHTLVAPFTSSDSAELYFGP